MGESGLAPGFSAGSLGHRRGGASSTRTLKWGCRQEKGQEGAADRQVAAGALGLYCGPSWEGFLEEPAMELLCVAWVTPGGSSCLQQCSQEGGTSSGFSSAGLLVKGWTQTPETSEVPPPPAVSLL